MQNLKNSYQNWSLLPILVFFLLLSMLSSCGYVQPEIIGVENFKFGGYNHLKRSLILQYDPIVHNPNEMTFFVDKVETDIYMDGIHVGDAGSDKRIDIPAKSDAHFTLTQNVKVQDFRKTITTFLRKDSIKVEIKGKYYFSAKSLEYAYPYTYETYIHPKKDLAGLLLGL